MKKDSKHPKKPTEKQTGLGLELEESAQEILAHLRGEVAFPTRRIVLPKDLDVQGLRNQAGMSQGEFARAFCINPRTLQEWDQGWPKPDEKTAGPSLIVTGWPDFLSR
jgi:DNA-binding transcriptional regulator YiaG